ncbi:ribosome biogenesis protein RLP24 [Venturia nashicola]|nr:ribosome biogenesis protein RLP24 [Venturia nashicola]
MVVDGALALASKRNVPVRYNRDHVAKALEAMVKFSEVRARRERVFYKNRMSGNRERQIEADRKLVEENQHLLPIELRDVTLKESHIDQEESMLMDEEEMDVDMEIDEKAEAAPLKSAMKTKKVKQTKQVKMKVGGGFEQQ